MAKQPTLTNYTTDIMPMVTQSIAKKRRREEKILNRC